MHTVHRYISLTCALLWLLLSMPIAALAAAPTMAIVKPGLLLELPADTGAHPDFRTEWWYLTGWLSTADAQPLGFQITFFRSATDHDRRNPSRFAPQQLIIGHAALSDPALGKLIHEQQSAREGFGIAYAKVGNTDVKLNDWRMLRLANGHYQAQVKTASFDLTLELTPTQAPLLQGEHGFSRKGPKPTQASYYLSEPQLTVSGKLARSGKQQSVTGSAWLDHEWSSNVLDTNASGWDWVGANLSDGGALMAFQVRDQKGDKIWSNASLRGADGRLTQFAPHEVNFSVLRRWRSPRTNALYPVVQMIQTGDLRWQLSPLQDDQELDARRSTGAVYWEGAVTLTRDGIPAGRGYLEMTGYLKALKL
jgi:predicted secreted hydrolase